MLRTSFFRSSMLLSSVELICLCALHTRAYKAVTEQLKQSGRGQTFGFIIGIIAIAGGVACILQGYEWAGGFIGGGGITGLVSVFVYGKRKQEKNLEGEKLTSNFFKT